MLIAAVLLLHCSLGCNLRGRKSRHYGLVDVGSCRERGLEEALRIVSLVAAGSVSRVQRRILARGYIADDLGDGRS